MHQTALSREGRKGNTGGRAGEIDHRLGLGKGFVRIIADNNTGGRTAHCCPYVATDPRVSGALEGAAQHGAITLIDCVDQHLTHTARGSGYNNFGHHAHLSAPWSLRPCITELLRLGKAPPSA